MVWQKAFLLIKIILCKQNFTEVLSFKYLDGKSLIKTALPEVKVQL